MDEREATMREREHEREDRRGIGEESKRETNVERSNKLWGNYWLTSAQDVEDFSNEAKRD